MERLSTRLPEDDIEAVERVADEIGEKRGTAARELIQSALAARRGPSTDDRIQSVRDEYETRIEDLETELARCRRARRQLLAQREEHGELVAAVERDRSVAERRARAGLWTKLKWAVTGMPEDE